MQPQSHEFIRPVSPQRPLLTDYNGNLHIQTHFDNNVPANKVIHITNFNQSSLSGTLDSFPEDSCDSFCMDTDTEDASMPVKTGTVDSESYPSFMSELNKAINDSISVVKSESNEPYHMPARRFMSNPTDDLSPHKELKHLMKEVSVSSTPEYSPQNPDLLVIDKLTSEVPAIEIVEEPETTYRARYESEGCKGPIHGISETTFPTIKICGYVGEVTINVFVVTRDNEPHLHTATGPGSTKALCNEVILENQIPAVQMILKPEDENDEMIAVFDQLSIRRIRNWEADKELRKRGIEPASWKSKKKEAKLAYQASITATKNHPAYLLTAYSRSFLCTAPAGNPEIWWSSLNECAAEGGEEMAFIGKKFASGFKVRFFSKEDDGNTWEACAEIDRTKSNMNACVIKVPPYKETTIVQNMVVHVEIRVGPEKEPRSSDPYPFTYITNKNISACENCTQIKGFLQRIFSGQSSEVPAGFSLNNLNTKTEPELIKPDSNTTFINKVSQSTVAADLRTLLQTNTIASLANVTPGVLYAPKVTQVNNVLPINTSILTCSSSAVMQVPNPSLLDSTVLLSPVIPRRDIKNITTQKAVSNVVPVMSYIPKPTESTKQTFATQIVPIANILPVVQNLPIANTIAGNIQSRGAFTDNGNTNDLSVSSSPGNFAISPRVLTPTKVKEEQISPRFHFIKPISKPNDTIQNVRPTLMNSYNAVNNLIVSIPQTISQPTFTQLTSSQTTVQTVAPTSHLSSHGNGVPLEREIQLLTDHVQQLKKQLEIKDAESSLQKMLQQQEIFKQHQQQQVFLSPSQALVTSTQMEHQSSPQKQQQIVVTQSMIYEPPTKMRNLVAQYDTQSIQVLQDVLDNKSIQPSTAFQQNPIEKFSSTDKISMETELYARQNQKSPYLDSFQQQQQQRISSSIEGQVLSNGNGQVQPVFQQLSTFSSQTQPTFQNQPFQQQQNQQIFQEKMQVDPSPRNQSVSPALGTVFTTQQVPTNPYQSQQQQTNQIFMQQTEQAQQPMQANTFQQNQSQVPVISTPFQQQQQQQQQIQVQQILSNLSDVNNLSTFNTPASKENSWESRPSINDAIATNRIGYLNANEISQPEDTTEVKLENDPNSFLKTLQELNNSNQQSYSSLPSTPVAVSPAPNVFSSTVQVATIQNSLLETGEAEVSVDYSDAYKNINKTANTNETTAVENWNQSNAYQRTQSDSSQNGWYSEAWKEGLQNGNLH